MSLRLVALLVSAPVLLCSPLRSREVLPLKDDPSYQAGLRALHDRLPQLAATRFKDALKDRGKDDPALPEIQLRLVEALVRSGQLEEVLDLFDLPGLAGSQTALFWKARTLLLLGHFDDSSRLLGQLRDADDPALRRIATLTRARILASLGETQQARSLLEGLSGDDDPSTATEAILLRASLHLNAGDLEGTSRLLEEAAPELPSLEKQKRYLEARLALEREDWAAASTLFRSLIENPRHLPRHLFRASALGNADALVGLDQTDDAVAFLLSFLDDHSKVGHLEPFFDRLVPWTRQSDSLQELLQSRLLAWSSSPAPKAESILHSQHDPVVTALAAEFDSTPSSLTTYALYHRALYLADKNDPASVATARLLLARLRLENPDHPLALASLLETAHLHMGSKHPAAALGALEALEDMAGPGQLKAEAAELAARIHFSEKDWTKAAESFSRARENFQEAGAESCAINQGLSLLIAGQSAELGELLATIEDEEMARSLRLERALLAADQNKPEARQLLDTFLRRHPDHPRSGEARLALAELCLTAEPPDLSMARAQLDSVDPSHPQYEDADEIALRHLLARFKLSKLTGDWQNAIAEANAYLRTRDTPEEDAVLLKLAEAFYRNKDYNQAQILFLRLAKRDRASDLHEVARFFAARAALRVGTDSARVEGLDLLGQVASMGGPLAREARLQLGRAYIDIADPEKALAALDPLLDPADGSSSRIDALLLAAEAHRALGDDTHLAQCLAIYDTLLADPDLPYALNNRIHFQKGLALEESQRPDLALETYYEVINEENKPEGAPITEWQWFYKCGFQAILLLEQDRLWKSAYGVALKLRDTGGYRADEAKKRAEDLELKYQIWEYTPTTPDRG